MTDIPLATEQPVKDIATQLKELRGHPTLDVQRVVAAFGRTAYFPLMLVVAIALISPLSSIPLYSTFSGLAFACLAGSLLLGMNRLWLPGLLGRRQVSPRNLDLLISSFDWWARRLDPLTETRWPIFTIKPMRFIIEMTIFMAGILMPFFEVVPMSSSIIGLAVALLTLSLMARDGLLMIAGYITLGFAYSIPILAYRALLG